MVRKIYGDEWLPWISGSGGRSGGMPAWPGKLIRLVEDDSNMVNDPEDCAISERLHAEFPRQELAMLAAFDGLCPPREVDFAKLMWYREMRQVTIGGAATFF